MTFFVLDVGGEIGLLELISGDKDPFSLNSDFGTSTVVKNRTWPV